MDDIAKYNLARWDELVAAGVQYSRPFLHLDVESARREVDPEGLLGDVAGRDVLCLASGGGQQSAAFGLLGARITVFDLSPAQLERDRLAAAHYGLNIRIAQGDMRDLSCFADAGFDIVWHAYSINFVPDPRPAFAEAARVLRPGGFYRVQWFNPSTRCVDERSWTGEGYLLRHPYHEGADLTVANPGWEVWDVEREDGTRVQVTSPREYNHKLSTVINALAGLGFVLLRCAEEEGDAAAAQGSWEHFLAVTPRSSRYGRAIGLLDILESGSASGGGPSPDGDGAMTDEVVVNPAPPAASVGVAPLPVASAAAPPSF